MGDIIFKNIYDKINQSTKNINTYFDNIDYYNTNIYDILYKIPKYNIIIYILLIFIIYSIINKLNIRLNEIFTFLLCIILIYLLIKKDYTQFIQYTQIKKNQLNFLHKLIYNKDWEYANQNNILKPNNNKSYLYLNPVIVDFYYNIREYSQYNISSYVNSIIHSNNVIGYEYQTKIGIDKEYLNYSMAIEEVKKALNELNSIIYNLPFTQITYVKFNNSIKILHKLLNRHISDMSILIKNKNKLTDMNISKMPNNFYDEYFTINSNDTKSDNYMSIYNMY